MVSFSPKASVSRRCLDNADAMEGWTVEDDGCCGLVGCGLFLLDLNLFQKPPGRPPLVDLNICSVRWDAARAEQKMEVGVRWREHGLIRNRGAQEYKGY